MATRKTAAQRAATQTANAERADELTPEQMSEAMRAIAGSIQNGMTQEQIEAMAREHHQRVSG
jgi:hypothetical protein